MFYFTRPCGRHNISNSNSDGGLVMRLTKGKGFKDSHVDFLSRCNTCWLEEVWNFHFVTVKVAHLLSAAIRQNWFHFSAEYLVKHLDIIYLNQE